MACLRCGVPTTIKAHLIPQSFAKEVRDQATDHALVSGDGSFRATKNGLFDHHLLCSICDGHLGEHEKFAFHSLQSIRAATATSFNRTIEVDGFDTDRMLRFLCGLVWKYASTKRELGRIEVGKYQPLLAEIAFAGAPIPPSIDAFFMRAFTADADVYSYRAPMPQKVSGVNFIRIWLGGCLFFLKLDKRPNPSEPTERHWLRSRSRFLFSTPPLERIEEGRMTINMKWENAPLAAFLRKVSKHQTH
jgi:hypothetical protein